MRAFELPQFGLQNLQLCERPMPVPGPGQVVVQVGAISLNYRDLLMVEGAYNPRQPLPLIPVSDGAGRIASVGEGVDRALIGQRVAGMFCQTWADGPPTRDKLRGTLGGPLDGMLAEYVALPITGVSLVPAILSDVEAATLPCAALTAWSALVSEGELLPGQTVLLQGTGGVSVFALQIARALGARVIITSSKDAKLAKAAVLGAHHCINYVSTTDWGKRARQLSGGEGVDLVVEVGGADTLGQSLRALRVGGRICQIGILSGRKVLLDLAPILMSNVRIQGILVGSRARFEAMCRAIELHKIKPVVDEVFAFEHTTDAFDRLASGQHFGKVCVKVAELS